MLAPASVALIRAAVADLFARAKSRLFGYEVGDKRLMISVVPELSLPGLFAAASAEERARPDEAALVNLKVMAAAYMDAQRERATALVVKEVDAFLREARTGKVTTDVETVLGGRLAELWGKVRGDVRRIVDTELNQAKNLGLLEGIGRINASAGIDDPVVYWVGPNDEHTCAECKRLLLLEDGKTPRVWRMSEVGHAHHKRGDAEPKLGGLHPNCRHSLATLLPGYGFSKGQVSYIGPDHDEYARQRGLEKSESPEWEPLRKDIPTRSFLSEIARFGWVFDRHGGDHDVYVNPSIPGSRPFPLRHMHAKRVDDHHVRNKYAGQLGLKWDHASGGYQADPSHPYAEHYRKMGVLQDRPPIQEPKTWKPEVPHVSVPIGDMVGTAPGTKDWKVVQHYGNLMQGRHHMVPPIRALDNGDGRYLVEDGEEQLVAAKRAGMTHVPVVVV